MKLPVVPDNLIDLKIEIWLSKKEPKPILWMYLGWTEEDYKLWKAKGWLPWVETVYSISAVGLPNSKTMKVAVDKVFDFFEKKKKYKYHESWEQTVEALFRTLQPERLENELIAAFLFCGLPYSANSPAYNLFKDIAIWCIKARNND